MRIASLLAPLAERLNPVVVKELRQGLQSRAFIYIFLLMQGCLALTMFATISAASMERAGGAGDIPAFWFIVALPVAIVIPLRGFGAIFHEVKGRTLDMLLLTRLTATRIVWGKWLSIVAQAVLAAIVVLPYLIMRYFAGGVNILTDLTVVGFLLMFGCLLAAVTVSLSAIPLPIIRLLAGLAGGIIAIGGLEAAGSILFGRGISPPTFHDILATAGVLLFAIPLVLSWGAGRIAHPAENHAVPTRLLALALIAMLWTYDTTGLWDGAILPAYLVWFVACASAMAEPARRHAVSGRIARRMGAAGRAAGWLLDTGWCQGYLYLLAVGLPLSLAVYYREMSGSGSPVLLLYALPSMILMPRLLIEWIGIRRERESMAYFLIFMLIVVAGIVPGALLPVLEVSGEKTGFLSILPSYAVLQTFNEPEYWDVHKVVSGFSLAAVAIVLLLRLPRAIRDCGRLGAKPGAGVPAP